MEDEDSRERDKQQLPEIKTKNSSERWWEIVRRGSGDLRRDVFERHELNRLLCEKLMDRGDEKVVASALRHWDVDRVDFQGFAKLMDTLMEREVQFDFEPSESIASNKSLVSSFLTAVGSRIQIQSQRKASSFKHCREFDHGHGTENNGAVPSRSKAARSFKVARRSEWLEDPESEASSHLNQPTKEDDNLTSHLSPARDSFHVHATKSRKATTEEASDKWVPMTRAPDEPQRTIRPLGIPLVESRDKTRVDEQQENERTRKRSIEILPSTIRTGFASPEPSITSSQRNLGKKTLGVFQVPSLKSMKQGRNPDESSKDFKVFVVWLGMTAIIGSSGIVMYLLEHDFELAQIEHYQGLYRKYEYVMANNLTCVTEGDIQTIRALVDHMKMVGGKINLDSKSGNWGLGGSVFFVMSIVTTIGYGNYSPQTDGGKAFISVFSIFGIAYFGFLLTLVSERMLRWLDFVMRKARNGNKYKPQPKQALIILAFTCVMYIMLLSLLGLWYGWGYGNSLYFAMLTFTTVGLGDFAPEFSRASETEKFLLPLFSGFALLFGVSLLSVIIGAVQEYATHLAEEFNRAKLNRFVAKWKLMRENSLRSIGSSSGRSRRLSLFNRRVSPA